MDNNKLEMLNGQRAVKELKEQGFKFIIMPGYNRSVDPKHVRNLMKSVREKGFFLNSIKFIPAEVWFQFYPERKITLESGKVIAKDSEFLDEILIILDGQHRYTADEEMGIEEAYQSTLTAERVNLPNNMTPDDWMTTVNSTSRNWDEKDRAGYIIALNPDERTNVSIAEQWRKDYGLSMRYSFGLLNFMDNYRKSSHLEYMRNPEDGLPFVLKGTAGNQQRGIDTLHAIEVGFRNYPRVMKNMAVVDFVIEVYNETSDKDKMAVVKNLQTFLMSLSSEIAKNMNDFKDKTNRKNILRSAWRKFQKAISRADKRQEIILNAQIAEEEWHNMMTTK